MPRGGAKRSRETTTDDEVESVHSESDDGWSPQDESADEFQPDQSAPAAKKARAPSKGRVSEVLLAFRLSFK